ncbi:4-phosphopantetheinyl transferase family protein [Bizionia argentinensis JUB59]|uniref:4-phosphopantetheinyl transferase family protein n=1 Tax=Bizionia argentinensis JUB59 TaxID=1046627 RepID=G2EFD0_9FLAO|nr:4'-phosphopantetheinyl transferase superfamily protein [Bizionia argentinensis]EGV42854.1 4-phosphopantetheinyl transferase family protein [Bizionia argentinensis JUB59]
MIGNDIIDLKETKRSTNWERRGFLDKIFTEKERKMISEAIDPFKTVWKLWSMKESAYKVFIQAGGKRFYNPKRIECRFEDGFDQVSIGFLNLKTETISTDDYILSTAKMDDADSKSFICNVPEIDIKEQSAFLKQKLITDFSTHYNLNLAYLAIKKTEVGVPKLLYKGKDLVVSFSLTHHGIYGSYSILNF